MESLFKELRIDLRYLEVFEENCLEVEDLIDLSSDDISSLFRGDERTQRKLRKWIKITENRSNDSVISSTARMRPKQSRKHREQESNIDEILDTIEDFHHYRGNERPNPTRSRKKMPKNNPPKTREFYRQTSTKSLLYENDENIPMNQISCDRDEVLATGSDVNSDADLDDIFEKISESHKYRANPRLKRTRSTRRSLSSTTSIPENDEKKVISGQSVSVSMSIEHPAPTLQQNLSKNADGDDIIDEIADLHESRVSSRRVKTEIQPERRQQQQSPPKSSSSQEGNHYEKKTISAVGNPILELFAKLRISSKLSEICAAENLDIEHLQELSVDEMKELKFKMGDRAKLIHWQEEQQRVVDDRLTCVEPQHVTTRRKREEISHSDVSARLEQVRLETEDNSRREAEENARIEAEAIARSEVEENVRLEAEQKKRLEIERARLEAEEKARIEAEEKARIAAEEKARLEAEEEKRFEDERARREAETKARIAAEEKARLAAEEEKKRFEVERARREAETKARIAAEEKARLAAEEEKKRFEVERARLEAEEKARMDAEEKSRIAAEEKYRMEAEEKKRVEAETARLESEAEEKKRLDADRTRAEAEENDQIEATQKPRIEVELNKRPEATKPQLEAEEQTHIESEGKDHLEAEQNTNFDWDSDSSSSDSESCVYSTSTFTGSGGLPPPPPPPPPPATVPSLRSPSEILVPPHLLKLVPPPFKIPVENNTEKTCFDLNNETSSGHSLRKTEVSGCESKKIDKELSCQSKMEAKDLLDSSSLTLRCFGCDTEFMKQILMKHSDENYCPSCFEDLLDGSSDSENLS